MIGLALLVAGTLAVLVFGSCGSGTTARARTYTVEYVVSGSAERALVTYGSGAGNYSQADTTLPWRLTADMRDGDLPTLTAQSSSESGDLACQILLDGQPWQSAESNAAYGSVTCSGMIDQE